MRKQDKLILAGGAIVGVTAVAVAIATAQPGPGPGKGRLEVRALSDSQSVSANVVVVGTGLVGSTPVTFDLVPGTYTVEATYGDVTKSLEATVTENETTTLIFQFQEPQPTVTLTISAGAHGTTDPAPGTYSYAKGTQLSVRAIPDPYYALDYWLKNGVNVGSANPLPLTLNENTALRAEFKPVATGYLTVHAYADSTLVEAYIRVIEAGIVGWTPFTDILPAGTYTVEASYAGQTQTKTADVLAGGTAWVTFQFQYPVTPTVRLTVGWTNFSDNKNKPPYVYRVYEKSPSDPYDVLVYERTYLEIGTYPPNHEGAKGTWVVHIFFSPANEVIWTGNVQKDTSISYDYMSGVWTET